MAEVLSAPPLLSEKAFQQMVIDLAHALGWRVAHFRAARVLINGRETWRTPVQADGAGWFDLVLVRPPRVLVVEAKSDKGHPTPAQAEWLTLLRACPGVEAYLWRPGDWEEIKRVLDR